jgi:hypothetical protein
MLVLICMQQVWTLLALAMQSALLLLLLLVWHRTMAAAAAELEPVVLQQAGHLALACTSRQAWSTSKSMQATAAAAVEVVPLQRTVSSIKVWGALAASEALGCINLSSSNCHNNRSSSNRNRSSSSSSKRSSASMTHHQ